MRSRSVFVYQSGSHTLSSVACVSSHGNLMFLSFPSPQVILHPSIHSFQQLFLIPVLSRHSRPDGDTHIWVCVV